MSRESDWVWTKYSLHWQPDEGGTYTAANVRDLIQMVICPVCKGNGYVRKVDDIEQCSACDSKGELDVAV